MSFHELFEKNMHAYTYYHFTPTYDLRKTYHVLSLDYDDTLFVALLADSVAVISRYSGIVFYEHLLNISFHDLVLLTDL